MLFVPAEGQSATNLAPRKQFTSVSGIVSDNYILLKSMSEL